MNPAVSAFVAALEHPHRGQVERWRALILAADPAIREKVKWNAPSYRLADHFATFPAAARIACTGRPAHRGEEPPGAADRADRRPGGSAGVARSRIGRC
ncbi:DUF1801 domain-containing protein [Deinococcus sp.]|uniref:DUF1801 domain-containing protein n=1 Tax=Deinococcus sp. TaxID=47478 RepID=UPI0028698FB0|nr:DUF1801 domain-containing protein [Deinococcus sp.]